MNTCTLRVWLALFAAATAGCMATAEPPVTSESASRILDEIRRAFVPPELVVGDKAPAFEPSAWVRGGAARAITPGQVYVLDFWASWCGPCIAAMPHMSDLQDELGDAVTIIAVNVREEDPESGGAAPVATIEAFLDKAGERFRLPVALGDRRLDEAWLGASGRAALPSYAVIDQDLKLAWIGGDKKHLRDVVKRLVAGDYDADAARDEQLQEARVQYLGRTVNEAAVSGNSKGDLTRYFELCAAVSYAAEPSEALYLASLMNGILTHPLLEGKRDLETAERGSRRACELTAWEVSEPIRVLALATFMGGDAAGAIRLAEKALDASPADGRQTRARIESDLLEYRAGGEDYDEPPAQTPSHGV